MAGGRITRRKGQREPWHINGAGWCSHQQFVHVSESNVRNPFNDRFAIIVAIDCVAFQCGMGCAKPIELSQTSLNQLANAYQCGTSRFIFDFQGAFSTGSAKKPLATIG